MCTHFKQTLHHFDLSTLLDWPHVLVGSEAHSRDCGMQLGEEGTTWPAYLLV